MKGRKPNPNRPQYASTIAEARAKKGWTQAQLGEKVGKDAATIKKYEGGTRIPPFDVLYDICEVLGINVYDVMDLDLRNDYSTGFHQFVDEPFAEIESLLNEDISTVTLSDIGAGTSNGVLVHYNEKEGYISKMEFILKVAEIKRKLQAIYDMQLSEAVSKLAIDIAEGRYPKKD